MHECPLCAAAELEVKPYELRPRPVGLVLSRPTRISWASRPEVCPNCGFEFGNDDNQARRSPARSTSTEVKGFILTAGARDSVGRPPATIMQMDGISLLDPQEDEVARDLTPVTALLGLVDLATLDTLITAGIAASRAEAARWALARTREQAGLRAARRAGTGARRATGTGSPGPGRAGAAANHAR